MATTTNELMTPGEVAELFGVTPKTVSRWADNMTRYGTALAVVKTPGGHRRFNRRQIEALYDQSQGNEPRTVDA